MCIEPPTLIAGPGPQRWSHLLIVTELLGCAPVLWSQGAIAIKREWDGQSTQSGVFKGPEAPVWAPAPESLDKLIEGNFEVLYLHGFLLGPSRRFTNKTQIVFEK